MRLSATAVTLAVLLVVGLAGAPAAVGAQSAQAAPGGVAEAYNQNVDQLPDLIRNRFADERVVMTVERAGQEDVVYTAVTDDDAQIVSIEEGEHDPTLEVTTDEATLREVTNSSQPMNAAIDAYESEDVQVEGVGIANTVTVEATKLGYSIASGLGLL